MKQMMILAVLAMQFTKTMNCYIPISKRKVGIVVFWI